MKKIKIGIVLLTSVMMAGLVLFSSGATAAKPAPQEIDKVVFVHYPQPQRNEAYWSPVNAPELTDQNTRYKYTGIHWAVPNVAYAVNPVGAPEGTGAAIAASFQTWQAAPGDITFTRLDDTGLISGLILDYNNVVSWQDITSQYPGAIAVTVVWYYRGIKEIVDVDTVMNSGSGFKWSVNSEFPGNPDMDFGDTSAYDVQNIMTHEAGHWLMLGDLYQWNTQKLTMYGYGVLGELQKRTLGLGDELGIDRIY